VVNLPGGNPVGTLTLTPADPTDSYVISSVVALTSGLTPANVTCRLKAGATTLDSETVNIPGVEHHGQVILAGSVSLSTATPITVSCIPTPISGPSVTAGPVSITAIQVGSLG
jgi:hypothetical protein